MHAASMSPTPPWYTQRWPWLLMLGPAIVIAGGSYVTYLAYTHQDAMVVADYYKKGKGINQDLRRDRVASQLRLAFTARYDPADGRVRGTLASNGLALTRPFHIYLAHATLPEKDIKLDVKPEADGSFSVFLPLLERGRWQMVVEGEQRDWRLAATWHWPRDRGVAVAADPVAP